MDDRKDRLHELKIACAILETSIAELAREWDCSDTAIFYTAQVPTTSKRLREKVEETIEKAKKKVPFKYPEKMVA